MSAPGGSRRLFPPPRRRPGLLTILVRWRVELVIAAAMGTMCWFAGYWVLLTVVAVAVLTAIVFPSARVGLVGLLQAIVIPHRVRSALIQAGVTDRAGRPPWILYARVHGETVFVRIWLRSGTTATDLDEATEVIGTSCGAAKVAVTRRSARQDRAIIVVYRPRWGWPGR
jgi:hypothetical protein